ncbi:MAG TPA: LytTR family DNA-binding domain-containing protein [Gammaproteobacteria bacterium]|nr:LytTR family DNA-binding domain-containing protein [Gammaproteobacteria bacterium]
MQILIADDEAPARSRLRRMIGELAAGEIVGEAASGREVLALAASRRPDVVLLDIRMPEGDGIAVARSLTKLEPPPAVVFVTAFADRALPALEAGAAAYLVKPVSREALAAALVRASRPSRAQLTALAAEGAVPRHLTVRVGRESRRIAFADLRYLRAENKRTLVAYASGEAVLDDSLAALEREFAAQLLRIRRNLLVARAAIASVIHEPAGTIVVLGSGERLPVARRHRRALASALAESRP